jgi:hypothetical protein
MKWGCIILLFAFFLGNITHVSLSVSFRNLSPPDTALLRIITGISINQCNFECSIRSGCDSIGYKTVINICKLYISSGLLPTNEARLVTVSKTDMDADKVNSTILISITG